jgi:exodeoxyribonuclease VII large subunit
MLIEHFGRGYEPTIAMTSIRPQARQALPGSAVYTVSELNHEVRAMLEANYPPIWIEGEISNLSRPVSGHLYFSLKDRRCQIRCAMFRLYNRGLEFPVANGQQVLMRARVSLYPERGDFQLIAEYMEEAGAGALRRAFEALKQKLSAEGLFDNARKQPLPMVPTRLGIISSPTGAAIRDIVTVLKRRFPGLPVLIYPVPVQGTGAADEIARMLRVASVHGACDLLILARGGGSLEDLAAFNEEVVARAVAASQIPVVTGIGHEIDFTIADLVADRRAPTPSAAAELVTPDRAQLQQHLTKLRQRLALRTRARLQAERQRLAWMQRRLVHPRRQLRDRIQRNDELYLRLRRRLSTTLMVRGGHLATLVARLDRVNPSVSLRAHRAQRDQLRQRLFIATGQNLERRRLRLSALRRQLEALNPERTLQRGYAIVTHLPSGAILREATAVVEGDRIRAKLAQGELLGTVDEVSLQ